MSKQYLSQVLDDISKNGVDSEKLRKVAGGFVTSYNLSASQVASEIKLQIYKYYGYRETPKRNKVIEDACKKYVEALVNAFRANKFSNPKNKRGYSVITSKIDVKSLGGGEWSITVSGSDDNFRVFKDRKRPYARLLEKEITKGFGIAQKDSPFIKRQIGKNKYTGGLLDLGHFGESEIANNLANLMLDDVGPDLMRLADSNIILKEQLQKIGFSHSPEFIYTIREESLGDNRSRGGLVDTRLAQIKAQLERLAVLDIAGSPSARSEIKRLLVEAGRTGKVKLKKTNTTVKKETKIPVKRSKVTVRGPKVSAERAVEEGRNWTSLIPIINAKLSAQVKANMGEPGLVNRTGTFADSAKVSGVTVTPQGYPSFIMSYDKIPYGVFDRRSGSLPWATPERDPYSIIERSIRQILGDFMIGRFYLQRS